MVMHSDAIVFSFYKTIVDWPDCCKASGWFTSFYHIDTYSLKQTSHGVCYAGPDLPIESP